MLNFGRDFKFERDRFLIKFYCNFIISISIEELNFFDNYDSKECLNIVEYRNEMEIWLCEDRFSKENGNKLGKKVSGGMK